MNATMHHIVERNTASTKRGGHCSVLCLNRAEMMEEMHAAATECAA